MSLLLTKCKFWNMLRQYYSLIKTLHRIEIMAKLFNLNHMHKYICEPNQEVFSIFPNYLLSL